MPHPVLGAAARYRAQLLAQERQAATRLVQAYGRAYQGLTVELEALIAATATLETPGEADIRRLASLRSLRAQIADQVERYAVYADQEIAAGVSRSIELGLQGSLGTVQAYFGNPRTQAAIAARWDMLAAEGIETALGFTASDSPLRARLVNVLGEVVAERAADALVTGIATGQNPRVVATILRRELGAGLSWSLTTARTAQLWSYRETSRLNYAANADIVQGWRWQAALDDRTCLSCWMQHGSTHGNDETLNGHHNCRCTMIPIVPLARRLGLQEPELEPGPELFRRLPEATQRQRMGPARYAAWVDGAFELESIPHAYEDGVYGTMLAEATLGELVGESRARKYIDMARVVPRRK